MPSAKVGTLFADSICLDPALSNLLLIILDDFHDFLVQSCDMTAALVKPLLFTIVLELEDCIGYDSMHNIRVELPNVIYPSVSCYVQEHGEKEEIFVKGQLIFHILDFSEHLIDH